MMVSSIVSCAKSVPCHGGVEVVHVDECDGWPLPQSGSRSTVMSGNVALGRGSR